MNKSNLALGVALVAVILAIGLYLFPQSSPVKLGGFTQYDSLLTNGLVVGTTTSSTNSSILSFVKTGSCALIVRAGTVTASTTQPYDCAVSGALSTDIVMANIATSTSYPTTQVSGFYAVGATASSTNGFITVLLFNGTGVATNPTTAGYASTTNYALLRTVTSVPGL